MHIVHPGGHLDQLMRQTRQHHVQLSAMADAKANMLITVSSLMITLCVGLVREPELRAVAGTLIGFSALTVMLAAYVAMPKLSFSRAPAAADSRSATFNPLFFGDFVSLDYPTYIQHMEQVLANPDQAYESMVREVYLMGQYLASRKYRFLGYAYLSFLAGIATTALVWVVTQFS